MKLQVVEGQYGKRIVFTNFNIKHSNPDAEKIGKGQFKRFLSAIGIKDPIQTAEEVHSKINNKILWVKVGIGKHYQSGEPTNEVKDYADKPKDQAATTAAQPPGVMADVPF